MTIIDINSVEQPVDTEKFKILQKVSDYPYCLLGFQIKNSYDQLRLNFSKKYNSKDIAHFVYYPETEAILFRGLKLTPTPKLLKLLEKLKEKEFYFLGDLKLKTYNETLATYNVGCDNCFIYLRPGIYPIDSTNIKSLVEESIDINELYHDIFSQEDVPFFQSVGYIALFILDKQNIANKSLQTEIKKISQTQKILY